MSDSANEIVREMYESGRFDKSSQALMQQRNRIREALGLEVPHGLVAVDEWWEEAEPEFADRFGTQTGTANKSGGTEQSTTDAE